MTIDVAAAKRRLVEKERLRRESLHESYLAACRDVDAIVSVLAEKFDPVRIYQWGSLLNENIFWEHSDIDIGVEGIRSAEEHAAMQAEAERITDFPVDLVNMHKIDVPHAEEIRNRGKVVYERK